MPEGGVFAYDEPVDVTVAKDKVEIAVQLRNAGVPVSDDYFYEITGIPKPDNYDEMIAAQEAKRQTEAEAAAMNPFAKKLSVEEGIQKALSDFFGNALNG